MDNGMEALRDAEFKDEKPIKTVERIQQILRDNGIETEQRWMETGVPYCYAIRLKVAGTTFAVNGKGLTREFALASGYGELMERLQLGYIGGSDVQKDGEYSVGLSRSSRLPAVELLERNRSWYDAYSRQLGRYQEEADCGEQILMQYAGADGTVDVTAYHNIVTGQTEHLPTALVKAVYSSNGCAAGNTMEEAIVQGISEIVERSHQLHVVEEALTLPDVPEEVLKKYAVAYGIITYVRSQGFRVSIKDCSLGTKFPVVCACIVDERTGKYHTHYGAYPIFEIALERSLTESFQGRNISAVAEFESFLHKTDDAKSPASLLSEMTRGATEKMPCFFVGEPSYAWHEDVGFTGRNNRELLHECVGFFRERGYDVLVRDGSCLGFPACQILIPGFSEVFIHRLSGKLSEMRYLPSAVQALRDPTAAKAGTIMGFLMHLNQMKRFASHIRGYHGFLAGAKLSAKLTGEEDGRFMAAALANMYYSLGRFAEAAKCVDTLTAALEGDDREYLICLKRYLTLTANRYDPAQVRQILAYFHRARTVEKLYACIEAKRNPLEPYTLRCDMKCGTECLLQGKCCQKRVNELAGLIARKTQALRMESFAEQMQALMKQ